MTRRDTILMAVLINAGLLVILFSTAITDHTPGSAPDFSPVAVVQETVTNEPSPAKRRAVPTVDARSAETAERALVVGRPNTFADGIAPVVAARPVSTPPTTTVASPSPRFVEEASDRVRISVKQGDTLDKIARANGTTIATIMEMNHLSSSRLRIGDTLVLPKRAAITSATKPVTTPTRGETDSNYYTIRSGDNPWAVAMKFHVPLDDLLRLNELDEDGARKLKPGDQIRIR